MHVTDSRHENRQITTKRLTCNTFWNRNFLLKLPYNGHTHTFPTHKHKHMHKSPSSSSCNCSSLSTAEHRHTERKCRGEPLAWSAPHLRRSTKSIKWSMFPRSFGSVPAPEAFPQVTYSSWVLLLQLFPHVYTSSTALSSPQQVKMKTPPTHTIRCSLNGEAAAKNKPRFGTNARERSQKLPF